MPGISKPEDACLLTEVKNTCTIVSLRVSIGMNQFRAIRLLQFLCFTSFPTPRKATLALFFLLSHFLLAWLMVYLILSLLSVGFLSLQLPRAILLISYQNKYSFGSDVLLVVLYLCSFSVCWGTGKVSSNCL